MAGELNLALVTAPPEDSQITTVPFALTPLYAVVPQTHAAAQKERVMLEDLAKDEWILLARRVHPVLPPQICAPAPATKANGIVAVRLSCQLAKGNPGSRALEQHSVDGAPSTSRPQIIM